MLHHLSAVGHARASDESHIANGVSHLSDLVFEFIEETGPILMLPDFEQLSFQFLGSGVWELVFKLFTILSEPAFFQKERRVDQILIHEGRENIEFFEQQLKHSIHRG